MKDKKVKETILSGQLSSHARGVKDVTKEDLQIIKDNIKEYYYEKI